MTKISLGRAFGQIGLLTACSRILGFGRDIVFAIFLGAGPAADAFLVALKLPNMFRRLSAEGAITNAFVPSFATARADQGEDAALRLAGEVQTMLVFVLVVLVALFELIMSSIISLLAPGFSATPERFDAAVNLARITMPYLPMISLVAFWSAIANAHDRFIPGAAMPIIFNLLLIGGALAVPLMSGLVSVERALPIAWMLLGAGIAQMGVMHVVLRRMGKVPILVASLRISPLASRMWRKFVPAAFGAIGMQLNMIVDLILASLLQVGAISWLYYADRLAQLPLGIVGIALGTALLPRLSQADAAGNTGEIRQALADAMILGAFLVVPAVAALIVLAEPILLGLFTHGAFRQDDAAMARLALIAYAAGLPGFVLIKILQPAFYAAGQPGIALKTSLAMVATNIIASLALMGPFGHVGLAVATSLSGLLAAVILLLLLVARSKLDASMVGPVIRTGAATAAMVLLLFGCLAWLPAMGAVLRLVVLVGIGAAGYFLGARLFGAIPTRLFRG